MSTLSQSRALGLRQSEVAAAAAIAFWCPAWTFMARSGLAICREAMINPDSAIACLPARKAAAFRVALPQRPEKPPGQAPASTFW